jgi:hypothetical protein
VPSGMRRGGSSSASVTEKVHFGESSVNMSQVGRCYNGTNLFLFLFFWCTLFAVVSIGASLFLIQQFSGINAVVFFSTAVFRGAGIKSDVAASALVALANVIGVCRLLMLNFSAINRETSF